MVQKSIEGRTKNGPYIFVRPPQEYPGRRYRNGQYAYEHHVVWWINTGEVPTSGGDFVVHHKNEDKTDNDFSNLEKKLRSNHTKEHAKPIPGEHLACAFCGSAVFVSNRVRKRANKIGQSDFYCNRSCMAKHFGRGRPK